MLGFAHIALDRRVSSAFALAALARDQRRCSACCRRGSWRARTSTRRSRRAGRATSGPCAGGLRLTLVVSEIALASLLLVGRRSRPAQLQGPARRPGRLHGGGSRDDADRAAERPLSRAIGAGRLRTRRSSGDSPRCPACAPSARPARCRSADRTLVAASSSKAASRARRRRLARTSAPSRPAISRAMELQLAAGRGFSDADRASTPRVAIVNDTMARRYWPERIADRPTRRVHRHERVA